MLVMLDFWSNKLTMFNIGAIYVEAVLVSNSSVIIVVNYIL